MIKSGKGDYAVRKREICLLIVGLVVSGPVAHAATSERETLQGIKGIGVVIEDLGENEKLAGLTESSLRVLVELPLRKAGIRVGEDIRHPYLYLNLYCVAHKMGSEVVGFSYGYRLELNQLALLKRNSLSVIVPTWSCGGIGYCGTQRVGAIKESVAEMVDRFINDFLAVNPH